MAADSRPTIRVFVTDEERDLLRRAAAIDRRKMSSFLRHYGLAAAERLTRPGEFASANPNERNAT